MCRTQPDDGARRHVHRSDVRHGGGGDFDAVREDRRQGPRANCPTLPFHCLSPCLSLTFSLPFSLHFLDLLTAFSLPYLALLTAFFTACHCPSHCPSPPPSGPDPNLDVGWDRRSHRRALRWLDDRPGALAAVRRPSRLAMDLISGGSHCRRISHFVDLISSSTHWRTAGVFSLSPASPTGRCSGSLRSSG